MEIKLISNPTTPDWCLVKECTLVTVGKKFKNEPDMEWKKKILEARHSPIRELKFVFRFDGIPYWIAMHFVRHHVGCQPYIRSQRNDRQKDYDRTSASQDAPVDMIWSLNADSLITIAQKRLCLQASRETRDVVRQMCDLAIKSNPEFADVLKPACEWQGGVCHEMFPCWKNRKEI